MQAPELLLDPNTAQLLLTGDMHAALSSAKNDINISPELARIIGML